MTGATAGSGGARRFGFSAVVGHDDLKLALLLAAIDPGIGGVLLRGDKGSGKTTVARGLAALLPGHAPFVELPLGASEDRVIGSIDLGTALATGEARVRPGLLADAHGGVLYVDEVNLLADHLVDTLLDVAVSGEHRLERDGVSVVQPARFVLVGTMNPEEGELRPQLLDRFGLCVTVVAPDDPALRAEIVRRRLAFDRSPGARSAGDGDDAALAARLAATEPAGVGDDVVAFAIRLALAVGAEGLRADLVLCRAAAALAGWDGRAEATVADVERVAPLVLAHRRRRSPFDPPVLPPDELAEALAAARAATPPPADPPGRAGEAPPAGSPDSSGSTVTGGPEPTPPPGGRSGDGDGPGPASDGDDGRGSPTPPDGATDRPADSPASPDRPERPAGSPASPDRPEGPAGSPAPPAVAPGGGEPAPPGPDGRGAAPEGQPLTWGAARAAPDLPSAGAPPRAPTGAAGAAGAAGRRRGAGRQASPGAAPAGRGREVRDVPYDPAGRQPVAVTASVRSFAQRRAASPGARPEPGDLRGSVRQDRPGTLVVIALDTSGSMGARERVEAATGAVLGLLTDAYQRRDRLAVVTFDGEGARVALAPTSSVEVARTRLAALHTGGTTPLAAGIHTALDVARRQPGADARGHAVLVVVTDGRATAATAATGTPDPLAAALDAAQAVRAAGVPALVLDAETGTPRLGLAARLAEAMGAPCRPLATLPTALHDLTTPGA